jgi:hypothetical protein
MSEKQAPKNPPAPKAESKISAEALRSMVEAEDDFGHELRVGKILKQGQRFKHAGTYKDPFTGKPRQFDFRVQLERNNHVIHLAVEAKNLSKNSPAIICGMPRSVDESRHDRIECWDALAANFAAKVTRISPSLPYERGQFVGKSILRVQPDKNKIGAFLKIPDADIYDRWSQALSSCTEISEAIFETRPSFQCYHVVLPVVVVSNGSLWVAEYNEDGALTSAPKQTDACSYYVAQKMPLRAVPISREFEISHVHFCTARGLEAWFAKLRTWNHAEDFFLE